MYQINSRRGKRMGKVTLSLIISVLITLFPVLVQAQGLRAGGFGKGGSRSSGFGMNGSSRGGMVSNLGRGFVNRGTTSNFESMNLGKNRGFVNSGFGQGRFSSGFSDNRSNFTRTSNLTSSTLHTSNFSNRLSTVNRFRSRGLTNSGFSQINPPNLNSSNLNVDTLTHLPNAVNTKAGLIKPVNRVKSFDSRSITRTNDFNFNPVITDEETSALTDDLSTPPTTRTRIIRVERKNGVMHFTNISSTSGGEETTKTLFVRKKAVSTSRGSNLDGVLTASQSKDVLSSNSKMALGLTKVKPTTNSVSSHHDSVVNDDLVVNKKIVFNFFFGSPLFVSPFGFSLFFPSSGFFFVCPFNNFFFFNPFVFHPLVPSPFFAFRPLVPSPVVFNPFLFHPVFFSIFFNPFPFDSACFLDDTLVFNDLIIH
jgi:hypothetical protein